MVPRNLQELFLLMFSDLWYLLLLLWYHVCYLILFPLCFLSPTHQWFVLESQHVICHFFLQKLPNLTFARSHSVVSDPMDCSPPGSSVLAVTKSPSELVFYILFLPENIFTALFLSLPIPIHHSNPSRQTNLPLFSDHIILGFCVQITLPPTHQ